MLLKGKKALITGGTSGIGKAIAILFAKEGADIVIFGTNKEKGELARKEIKQIVPESHIIFNAVDVSKTGEIKKTITAILDEWGNIDILVNNAGITRDNLLMKMTEEEWDCVIDVNLKSVYNTTRALIHPMMKAKKGKIINITSVIGLTGNAGQVNYAASKSGMIGLTKSLAKELARRNICVNCIAPGFIRTKMTENILQEVREEWIKNIPLNRIGEPKDVAKAAVFLASEMSDYITGQVLIVDGGMVM